MNPTVLSGLAMAALLLLVVLLATRPWWRNQVGARQNRRAANVVAYRLRLAEIDNETASGLIPADEAVALRSELDARVLDDADASEPEVITRTARRPLAIALVTVLLAAFSGGWYVLGGSWQAQAQIAAGAVPPAPVDPQIAAMVETLAQRLKAQPDDPEGWTMLGRSYAVMSRYPDAAAAFGEANRRAPKPTAEGLSDEGEALAFASGQDVSGHAAELFEQALQLDPGNGKALWYGGLASALTGDYATARTRWQRLLDQPGLAEEMRAALGDRIVRLDQAIAANAAAVGEPAADSGAAAPTAAAPVSLKVQVSLAPALAGKVPAGATLFVFAKAASGPPMPLAVQKLGPAKLPLEVTLDESMAMAPGLSLSKFDQYVITARYSAAGSVQAQPGDLEGRIEATRAQSGGAPLAVVIDRVLP
ncbi:c-type cytochrome biogenesis protein CcmI [Nevskia sp.]|uniref:c-type cytochrome biogenesis protein CcmI n=1 Tax=Nevskia sp. TaxID=1929292 RepID=UPI0025DEF97F|nr:c-type cytochrome biogenesis protein CcmI [Nevskia sp.]